ncbi:THUMP-like domain-containing protein [Nocardioides bizhenqiangii]|uniref:SAM-dependent methyltransferase n=1 Tax=Nocardioides bizhenqiangii TaxID=3095076 RepID=A0ABZ0ZNS5_9ACTN|nr:MULTISPECIES: SAM-dependent methyltransferase [unclassified Nocardioides]MDZ5621421.1 SAM-dependent methyltransferase [Nocardioides sp. HM23]WQQ25740.1 SAM-dependent methyltransferase [Nocardioides sp. HM61]
MDLEAFRWLLTDEGQALLARATDLVDEPELQVQAELRRDASPAAVAVAMTQVELRHRGHTKFGELADRMYFTPSGLEQATRLSVAAHRAGRYGAFGARTLIDLGCGIGGDLIAGARAGLVCAGVDLDPVRVAIAEANLAALGLPGAVQVADATTVDHGGFDLAFADPARRSGAGRTFNVDDWAPPWTWIEGLLRRDACVKVAPGIPHALVPPDVEAEWVSDGGEVKEAALWSGRTATASRRATVIPSAGPGQAGGLASLTDEDDPGIEETGVGDVGAFLYEPDGAVIRAGLVTAVAAGVHGHLVDARIAYVTSDESFRTPFARGYRVLENLPYREKQLRAALRERGIGRLTIKKRGVDVAPDALRKRLALTGDEEATLVLTRVAGHGTALLVSPF